MHNNTKSHLSDGFRMLVHASEVLRHEAGTVVSLGGYAGGDYWFGSISSCLELKKVMELILLLQFKIILFFPINILHSTLMARYVNNHDRC